MRLWRALVNLIAGPVSSQLVDRVDAVIVEIEATKGGAVHPIRAIPLDIVAGVVEREVGDRPTDDALRTSLVGVLNRYDPPRITSLE